MLARKYYKIIPPVLAMVLLLITGCSEPVDELKENVKAEQVKNEDMKEDHSCCATEIHGEEFTENSIYQLESEWMDQSNKAFELKDLKGKKVVFTMFFASCTYACPILVNDMKKIESEIPKGELSDYKFLLVSIDPERDTPAFLNQFASQHSLDLNRWKLLAGSEGDIMELAALTGFRYKKDAGGEYSHSNIITILNEEGEIEFQHKGLNKDVTEAVKYLASIN